MKKKIINFSLIILVLILFYWLSLSLVMCIDNDVILANITASITKINEEGGNVWSMFNFYSYGSVIDNPTDLTMLTNAISYPEMSPFKFSLDVYDYARYWHGYLIVLKPLMMFTDIQGVRMFNSFIFYILLAIFVMKLKDTFKSYIPSIVVLIGLVLCYIYVIPLCMQYFNIFIISMLTSIIMIELINHNHEDKLIYLFFIVGSITNFFDFLTAPLITLGLPLAIYLLMNKDNCKKQIIDLVVFSTLWCLGYGVTWIAKWILATVILERNVILEGINQSIYRVNGDDYDVLRRDTMLVDNIKTFFYSKYYFMAFSGIAGLLCLFKVIKKHESILTFIPFVLLAFYPFIWFNVLGSHSAIHYYMTYRILLIYFVSLCFGIYKLYKN